MTHSARMEAGWGGGGGGVGRAGGREEGGLIRCCEDHVINGENIAHFSESQLLLTLISTCFFPSDVGHSSVNTSSSILSK